MGLKASSAARSVSLPLPLVGLRKEAPTADTTADTDMADNASSTMKGMHGEVIELLDLLCFVHSNWSYM